MKMLITGYKGFIGTHLSRSLTAAGHLLLGYDIDDGFDICNKRQLEYYFETENFDCLIHLAALTGARRGEDYPQDYFTTNAVGTLNVVRMAEKYGVKRLIHFSSSSVKQPNTIYGMSKYVGELIAQRSKVPVVSIIRPFTVVGQHGRADQVVQKWINEINAGRTVKVHGLQTNRNFTAVDDVIRLVQNVLTDHSSKLYELCNPKKITLKELVDVFVKKKPDLMFENVGLTMYEPAENTGRWDASFVPTNALELITTIVSEQLP